MYESYFYNVNTHELFRSGNPKDDKIVGVDGWKRISRDEYMNRAVLEDCKKLLYIFGYELYGQEEEKKARELLAELESL